MMDTALPTPQLDDAQLLALTQGGDTLLHYHLSDRVPTHDTLLGLQKAEYVHSVAGPYTATYNDDLILCSGGNVTLPAAKNGKIIEVLQTTTSNVTVLPTGSDTVEGTSSVSMLVQWLALTFKAISGGWVII